MTTIAASGLQLFARYAYPPNERGYCGPQDPQELAAYLRQGTSDPGLMRLARAFDGPLPYLQSIAAAAGTDDPFSQEVVEAYWVGNDLLDHVDDETFRAALHAGFATHPGAEWTRVQAALPGGVPHHSFHVFVTYPWAGLLRTGRAEPLRVLDQCRIRWGQVETASPERLLVRSEPLAFDGQQLHLGPARVEDAAQPVDGSQADRPLEPGDWVALHWQWICDRLSSRQVDDLRRHSASQLRLVNERVLSRT